MFSSEMDPHANFGISLQGLPELDGGGEDRGKGAPSGASFAGSRFSMEELKSMQEAYMAEFTGCSVNGPNMQCDTNNGGGSCNFNYMIGAVSCKEPGYIGCFSDFNFFWPGRDHVLSNGPRDYIDILTIDLCINSCEEDGFFYAGVEFRYQCFCGGQHENLVKHGNASDGECDNICTGDRLESCGGADLIAIYQVGLGVCEDPGTPNNGFRYKKTGSLRYGSKIYFNCSDGYTLEGPEVIQCVQMYGRRENIDIANITHAVMWNRGLPKCKGFNSTTPSSATTKGRGLTNPVTFSGSTGPKQQSGFNSTTPSSATTKGGGLTNPVTFSGTTGPKQQSGFNSTTPSSATTKGGGLTNPVTFSGTTGPKQQSGHQFTIYTSIGIVSGLLLIIAIIFVVVICKRHRRRSNIALRQSISGREGQELDPYTSLDTTTMKQPAYEDIKATRHGNRGPTNAIEGVEYQTIVEHPYTSLDTTTMEQPAYEDIKATRHGNRGHTNAIEGVEYENQTIVEHPYTSLDTTTMEQPAYDDTIAPTRRDISQMNAIEGAEYENQRIVEQTARVKKSNLGVADGNTEAEYELLN